MASPVTGSKQDAPNNARGERCPSWRQLYRISCTLAELAKIPAPKTAREASALIAQLDALASGDVSAVEIVKTGDGCPF